MYKFLRFFYNITMVTQNIFDTINKILLVMNYLFIYFEIEYQNYIIKSFIAAYVDAI